MQSSEDSFVTFLRGEVDSAGTSYERARQRVFALTGEPEIQAGPALLEATEVLAEAMKGYINALRRLANYAAHRTPAQKFTHHA